MHGDFGLVMIIIIIQKIDECVDSWQKEEHMLEISFNKPGDFERYINAVITLIEFYSKKEFLLISDNERIEAILFLIKNGDLS